MLNFREDYLTFMNAQGETEIALEDICIYKF